MIMSVNVYVMLFFAMIFCHIFDDYFLQGCLANLKQLAWWKKNYPNNKYKYDYIMALACHSLSWSFSIIVPLLIYTAGNIGWVIWTIPVNALIHGIIDDLKANKLKINLIQDQLFHLVQISVTFAAFVAYSILK